MDAPPSLPSRTRRFQGWLRLGLCLAALGTIISATQHDNLLECSLSRLMVVGREHIPKIHPHNRFLNLTLRISIIVGIGGPVLAPLLAAVTGGLAALSVACRWRSTPWTAWLVSYAFFWTAMFILLGLTLRWLFGDAVALQKGGMLQAYLLLWPGAFLTLSGCYARLLRTGTSPLPDLPRPRSQASGNVR